MIIRKAFKFELMPDGEQSRKMKNFCGCSRFVFNQALDWQNKQYEADKTFRFGYTKIANLLPGWKLKFRWLSECHSQVLQQSLKNLESAFCYFFSKRAQFPRFKKKAVKESFRFPQGFKLDEGNRRLYLPKIGWIRYRKSRDVLGTIKNMTVSLQCDKWFVAIQTEREQVSVMQNDSEIGIDLGIVRFATLSNGEYFAPKNSLKVCLAKLKKAQQLLSRKKKYSQNWYKAKNKVSKCHYHIANSRRDYLHKISNTISKNHAIVYLEDLQVANMSKSAKGDKENPGHRVRQKSGLNRSILDQGWNEFRRQLDYKLTWQGGEVILVDPKYTSQTCPNPECLSVSKENRQTQSEFKCVACGYENNADFVGALNVLRAGHAQLACEVNGAVMPSAAGTHRSELVMHH